MFEKTLLVTGGAGFIGANFIDYFTEAHPEYRLVNLDLLTYAARREVFERQGKMANVETVHGDIRDTALLHEVLRKFNVAGVLHFAAESHVDNSIPDPLRFIETNVVGTATLLNECLLYWRENGTLETSRFHHVSTDEVYGSLGPEGFFTEETPYAPSSPYSASKASSDHLVRAWLRTYGLPTLITNCSNNYGPYHFPEKLIPLMILNALAGKPLPVYGNGQQIRDWLYVEDHARALYLVATRGEPGETYNIGGHNERKNIEVVETICELLEALAPNKPQGVAHYRDLIAFVADRPGHDLRYAIDASKIARELGWTPAETFTSGMRKTVAWYLANETWWRQVQDGSYQGERLGLQG